MVSSLGYTVYGFESMRFRFNLKPLMLAWFSVEYAIK